MTDIHRSNDQVTSPLDEHALSVLYSLRRERPEDAEKIDFVISRFHHLQAEPAENVQQYYASPRGSLRGVLQNMRHSGAPQREISHQLSAYQKWVSAALETHLKSADAYKRLNYLISR